MAIIQPKYLKNPTPGEKKLYKLFSNYLSDDTHVYYEKRVKDSLADFIIVDPDIGVMIIEAKDWDIDFWKGKISIKNGKIYINDKATNNPKDQALRYQKNTYHELNNSSSANIDKSSTRLPYPVNHLVSLHNMTRSEFDTICSDLDKLGRLLTPEQILFKEDYENVLSGDNPTQALTDLLVKKRRIGFIKGYDRINKEDMKYILAAIDPKVIIEDSPDGFFRTMEQSQIIESSFTPNSNRVLRGIAGSGKTIMLLHQIDHICHENKDKKILLVSFTTTLQAMFSDRYINNESVDIKGLKDMKDLENKSYDFVFIDECQDFSKDELQSIINKKRPAPEGFVILSTDWGQHLYFKEKRTADYSFFNFKYSELGLNIESEDIVDLTINYRNTQEIGLFAHYFLHEDSIKMTSAENEMNHMYLNKMQSALRSDGRIPEVVAYKKDTEIIDQVVARIIKFIAEGAEEKDIAILFSEHKNAKDLIERLTQKLSDRGYKPFSYLDDSNRKMIHNTNQVLLSTIHSSKGFEYKHVILCANHSFQTIYENTKRTFYVGLTRAQETLTVLVPKDKEALVTLFEIALKKTKDQVRTSNASSSDYSKVNKICENYQNAFRRIMNLIIHIRRDHSDEYLEEIYKISENMGISIEKPVIPTSNEYDIVIPVEKNEETNRGKIILSPEIIDPESYFTNDDTSISNNDLEAINKLIQEDDPISVPKHEPTDLDSSYANEYVTSPVDITPDRKETKKSIQIIFLPIIILFLAFGSMNLRSDNTIITSIIDLFGTITDADEVDGVQHDSVITETLIAQFYFMPSSLDDLVNKEFEFPAPINDVLDKVYSDGVPNKRKVQANYTNITATLLARDTNKTHNELYDDIIREGSVLSIRKNIDSGLVTIEMNMYEKDGTAINENIELEKGTESLKFIFGNNYVVYSTLNNATNTTTDNVSDRLNQVMKVKRDPKSKKWLVMIDLQ